VKIIAVVTEAIINAPNAQNNVNLCSICRNNWLAWYRRFSRCLNSVPPDPSTDTTSSIIAYMPGRNGAPTGRDDILTGALIPARRAMSIMRSSMPNANAIVGTGIASSRIGGFFGTVPLLMR